MFKPLTPKLLIFKPPPPGFRPSAAQTLLMHPSGAQGRIRTFVPRKEEQIYSLLALTTHPPVQKPPNPVPSWSTSHPATRRRLRISAEDSSCSRPGHTAAEIRMRQKKNGWARTRSCTRKKHHTWKSFLMECRWEIL
jgi:hypothetical protein